VALGAGHPWVMAHRQGELLTAAKLSLSIHSEKQTRWPVNSERQAGSEGDGLALTR
jgi:hypothetical protein